MVEGRWYFWLCCSHHSTCLHRPVICFLCLFRWPTLLWFFLRHHTLFFLQMILLIPFPQFGHAVLPPRSHLYLSVNSTESIDIIVRTDKLKICSLYQCWETTQLQPLCNSEVLFPISDFTYIKILPVNVWNFCNWFLLCLTVTVTQMNRNYKGLIAGTP